MGARRGSSATFTTLRLPAPTAARLAVITALFGAAVALLHAPGASADTNLIVNGSFEADACTSSTPGHKLGLVGTAVSGWFIPASDGLYPWCLQNVNVFGAGPAAEGKQWLVLGEVATGVDYSIQQTVAVVPGHTYHLSFAIASELGCCSVAEVSFLSGTSVPAQQFSAPSSGAFWTVWGTHALDLAATGPSLTLQFKNLARARADGGGIDLGLDNVVLTDTTPDNTTGTTGGRTTGGETGGFGATPELDSLLLFGAGGLGLAGYARMRLLAHRRRAEGK